MSEIDKKYAHLGGSNGFLGAPKGNESPCPDDIGHFRHYAFGSIYWSPASGAFSVQGAIQNKWAQMGWEKSFLGYPTTNETKTPDHIGRFNHFQHGSIYWKPTIGAHEVHGLIRQHWAANGWETNSNLGYPISDETPAAAGSANRYSEFENGIVFWRSGESSAFELSKFTLGGASKPVSEVFDAIKKLIVPMLSGKVDGRQLYITSGPALGGPEPIGSTNLADIPTLIRPVSDYSLSGGTVRNRQYKVRTGFGITVDGSADISVLLDLWIEVFYDHAKKAVFAAPRSVWFNTHVPWPTSWGISADEVNVKLKAFVGPEMNKLHQVATVLDAIHVLAVKVMPNGDLNVYIAPL